ncbi:uncharacterized protein LOC127279956 [Leptopilina boulardi]|uniref:uncharacterized protein LOC127279956 n=1 Tax=Leptopilina boulardi TaxID=63433 RepID=UPI0021F526C6|nr:uncharacterized protein LOC127279956 [Leptopilina boulardi]
MYHKEKEYLHQIAKASDAIRKKHRILKLGKEDAENTLNETFKPIEEEDEEDYISADENETIPGFDYEKVIGKYLYLINHNRKQCLDTVYGVRKLRDGSFMIGDKPISFDNHLVNIGDKRFNVTTGLLELLFKNKPEKAYISEEDERNYKEILIASNAHKKKYSSSEPIRTDKNFKFMNFISGLFPQRREPYVSGSSLPKFMITNRNFKPDYIYWDCPNELVDRLRLLMASQSAGNPSHNNEIMSIIEELREAKIIY